MDKWRLCRQQQQHNNKDEDNNESKGNQSDKYKKKVRFLGFCHEGPVERETWYVVPANTSDSSTIDINNKRKG